MNIFKASHSNNISDMVGKRVKAICPNCKKEITSLEEYWFGDDVEVNSVYTLENNNLKCTTKIGEASIRDNTFMYLCPICGEEIVLEKPYDVGGTSHKTDDEIITDFLNGKIKGK